MQHRSHPSVALLICAAAAMSVVVVLVGCRPPKDPKATTSEKLEGEKPPYLADEVEPYDKDRLQSIKGAASSTGSSANRYAVRLTFADVEIPAGLKTIDPAGLEKQPSNLANPALILNLASGKRIVVELFADKCPGTVNHLIPIVQSGFYSGLYFQRSDDMCIQGGDPAVSGKEPWPETVALEVNGLPFDVGSVGMARTSDPNSGSSQFFIIKARAAHLDQEYANFGVVLDGMDAVLAIPARDQTDQQAPLDEDSRILSAEVVRFVGYEEAEAALLKQVQEVNTDGEVDGTARGSSPDTDES